MNDTSLPNSHPQPDNHEEQNILLQLFNSASHPHYLLDTNFHILMLNEAALASKCHLWDQLPAQGESVLKGVRAEYVDLFQEGLTSAEGGAPYAIDCRIALPNNALVYYAVQFMPIKNGDQVNALSLTVQDITQRQLAEQIAKSKDALYQQLLHHLPSISVLIFDSDFRILLAGGDALSDYGYNPETIIGKTLDDILQPDNVGILKKSYTLAFGGQPIRFEFSTERFTFDIQAIPLVDERERVTQIMVVSHDVTPHKRAIQAARDQENLLKQLTENIDYVFYVRDPIDNKMLYISPAYEKVWGQSVEALYQNADDFIKPILPEDWAKAFPQLVKDTADKGRSVIEYRIRKPDGTLRSIRATTFAVYDSEGKVYRTAGLAEDITERRAYEQAQLKLAIETEKRHMLGAFVQDALHEFRTPLAIINAKLYLLESRNEPDKQRAYIHGIEDQTKVIVRLVDQLAHITELDTAVPFKSGAINMTQLLDEVLATVKQRLHDKALTLKTTFPDELPVIMGDEDKLFVALEEILDNAVRYSSPDGQLSVKVAADATRLTLNIADTGLGISHDALPHIFERFYRQDTAHTTPGFGLGLPIAQAIIERHGGQIQVASVEGQGTTVQIKLPMV